MRAVGLVFIMMTIIARWSEADDDRNLNRCRTQELDVENETTKPGLHTNRDTSAKSERREQGRMTKKCLWVNPNANEMMKMNVVTRVSQ